MITWGEQVLEMNVFTASAGMVSILFMGSCKLVGLTSGDGFKRCERDSQHNMSCRAEHIMVLFVRQL